MNSERLGNRKDELETPLFDLLSHPSLRGAIQKTLTIPDGPEREEALRQLENRYLPSDYASREAHIIALTYDPELLDTGDESQSLISLTGAQLEGFTSARFAGSEQVVLEFTHHENDEAFGPDGKTSRYLVALSPDDVLAMRLDGEPTPETETLTFRQRIEEFTEVCQGFITDESFVSASEHERLEALQLLYLDARTMLAGEQGTLGGTVSLVCDAFYRTREGYSLRDIESRLVQPQEEGNVFVITGTHCKVFYPELALYPHRDFTSLEDFSMGAGTPCVSVRSADETFSYWVPLAAIHGFRPSYVPVQQ